MGSKMNFGISGTDSLSPDSLKISSLFFVLEELLEELIKELLESTSFVSVSMSESSGADLSPLAPAHCSARVFLLFGIGFEDFSGRFPLSLFALSIVEEGLWSLNSTTLFSISSNHADSCSVGFAGSFASVPLE